MKDEREPVATHPGWPPSSSSFFHPSSFILHPSLDRHAVEGYGYLFTTRQVRGARPGRAPPTTRPVPPDRPGGGPKRDDESDADDQPTGPQAAGAAVPQAPAPGPARLPAEE